MEEPAGPGGVREGTASLATNTQPVPCRGCGPSRCSRRRRVGSGAEPAVGDPYFGIDGFGAGLVLYGFAQL